MDRIKPPNITLRPEVKYSDEGKIITKFESSIQTEKKRFFTCKNSKYLVYKLNGWLVNPSNHFAIEKLCFWF